MLSMNIYFSFSRLGEVAICGQNLHQPHWSPAVEVALFHALYLFNFNNFQN
jgi:hypothetical protein